MGGGAAFTYACDAQKLCLGTDLSVDTCASPIRGTTGWYDNNVFSQQRDILEDGLALSTTVEAPDLFSEQHHSLAFSAGNPDAIAEQISVVCAHHPQVTTHPVSHRLQPSTDAYYFTCFSRCLSGSPSFQVIVFRILKDDDMSA